METFTFNNGPGGFRIAASRFAVPGGAAETHLFVVPTERADISTQLRALDAAYRFALSELKLTPLTAVFRRLFLSDYAGAERPLRESPLVDNGQNPVAVSLVEESPLPDGGVALWAYHIQTEPPLEKRRRGNSLAVARGSLTHLWTTGLVDSAATDPPDSSAQTEAIFGQYIDELGAINGTLANEAIRTWVFVRDIDHQYQGMVAARRDIFTRHGLTAQTHYIASTGIDGAHADPRCVVLMDAYAIGGINPGQIRFLTAPDHLSPTNVYGVTFERGTQISFGDRRHLWISGTASIDARGQIVAPGDVPRQCERTRANLAALLADGGATEKDIAQMIVYVREAADYPTVRRFVDDRFPGVPHVIVLAPICRPGWLVEIECLAVVGGGSARWAPY